MSNLLTYREQRREKSVSKFLNGKARHAYVLREDISCGLKGRISPDSDKEASPLKTKTEQSISTCDCEEILGSFCEKFQGMVHTGQKLIYRASIQEPKTAHKKYRDIQRQNQWLLENVFDSRGNYIFCFPCIKKILEVGGKRLHRLREIRRQQANMPVVQVRKDEVSKEQAPHVIAPINAADLLGWWMNLDEDSIVELRCPPKLHHGKSHYSKERLLPRFLEFIDNNSQSNGRRIGSHGALFFLNSKFDRINAPSKTDSEKSEQWKRRSLVYEFNRTLENQQHISNGTAKKWLKLHRPKHAISPKKTDYCEMCVECGEQKRRHETIAMRLQQNGDSDENEIIENQALAESYGFLLQEHKMDAGNELRYYREQTNQCYSLYQQLENLQKIENQSKEAQVKRLKLMGTLSYTISLDYQQSQLTPYWGFSAQPSETYYLRKLSHHIFGIVDHARAKNAVYVCEERVSSTKNADMTVSLTDHYVDHNIPLWVRHLRLFMDNGATNKNQFMIQWAMELVERGDYDSIRMCFFVPGHAKNDVDRLFSRLAHGLKQQDIFVTQQLIAQIQKTIEPTGSCINVNGQNMVNWKSLFEKKYTALKEIQRYRDFHIKRNSQGEVVVYHKESCYQGEYTSQILLRNEVDHAIDLKKACPDFTYEAKGMESNLSHEKLSDLGRMYDKFIDPVLRPEWVPEKPLVTLPHITNFSASSEMALEHRGTLKKNRKVLMHIK